MDLFFEVFSTNYICTINDFSFYNYVSFPYITYNCQITQLGVEKRMLKKGERYIFFSPQRVSK